MTVWVPHRSDTPTGVAADLAGLAFDNLLGGTGGVWALASGGVIGKSGGSFVEGAGSGGTYLDNSAGSTLGSQRISYKPTALVGSGCGVAFCAKDAANCYVYFGMYAGGDSRVFKVVAGAFTQIGAGTAVAAGDTGRVTYDAGMISLDRNGIADLAPFPDPTWVGGRYGLNFNDAAVANSFLVEAPSWTTWRSDRPVGANGTDIANRNWGDESGGSGGKWSTYTSGPVQIQTNQFFCSTVGGSIVPKDIGADAALAGAGKIRISAKFQGKTNSVFAGLCFGTVDGGNTYFFDVVGTASPWNAQFGKFVLGGFSGLTGASANTVVVGDIIRVTYDPVAHSMIGEINGVGQFVITDVSLGAGGYGFSFSNGPGTANFTDFVVERRTDEIGPAPPAGGGGSGRESAMAPSSTAESSALSSSMGSSSVGRVNP